MQLRTTSPANYTHTGESVFNSSIFLMCVFAEGVPKMTKKAPFYGHFYAPGNCSTGRVKLKTKNGSHPVRGVVRIHG